MEKSYQLTARQLYYLGKLLKARYIDYSYVSAITDILDNFATYENEIIDELSQKGLLTEDFSGQITVDSDLQEMLDPIFNGGTETAIDVCIFGNNESLQMYRFHSSDGKIVQVKNSADHLEISYVDYETIRKTIEDIIPETYTGENSTQIKEFDPSRIHEVISIKNAIFNDSSITKTYVMMDEVLYEETSENVINPVSRTSFIEEAEGILVEVM